MSHTVMHHISSHCSWIFESSIFSPVCHPPQFKSVVPNMFSRFWSKSGTLVHPEWVTIISVKRSYFDISENSKDKMDALKKGFT